MKPSFIFYYCENSGITNLVFPCKFIGGVFPRNILSPDFLCYAIRNLSVRVRFPSLAVAFFSKHIESMPPIFSVRNVLKVFNPIVCSYSIFVINLKSLWLSQKRKRDHLMKGCLFSFSILNKNANRVSLSKRLLGEEASRTISGVFTKPNNSPPAGHPVFSIVSRNVFPSFHHLGNGVLSVSESQGY